MSTDINNSNSLNFELDGKMSLVQIIVYVIFLALLLCFCLSQIFETNKTIFLSCNKPRNICTFGEYKPFKGMRYLDIEYSAVKDAYINTNHERGGNTYDFVIPTTKGKLYLYKGAYGVEYLLNLQQIFNDYKNKALQNSFTINQHNSFFFMLPTFCIFFILLLGKILIFNLGYKQSIVINKEKDLILFNIHRLVGSKTTSLKITEIKQIYIHKLNVNVSKIEIAVIQSLLNDGRKVNIISSPLDKATLVPICNSINEFIFGKFKNNEEINEGIYDKSDANLQKYDFDSIHAPKNAPLFTTKSPIIMGILAFLTVLYISAVLKIGFNVRWASIELFVLPIALLYSYIIGWRLQTKLSMEYNFKYTASVILPFLLFGFFEYHNSQAIKIDNYTMLFFLSVFYAILIYLINDIGSEHSSKSYIPPDVIPIDIKIRKRIICGISLGFIFLALLARVLNNAGFISINDNIIFSLTLGIPFAIFSFFQCMFKYSWMNYIPPSEDKDDE